ncbi:MAG: hypothetical protein QXS54_00280 [Candidatus Methanomethylicaceae archaeon]
MNVINLTPHKVVVITEDENHNPYVYEFPPSGVIARVSSTQTEVTCINGIPVVKTEIGEVENLPEPQDDTIYIVSSLVAQALAGKRDDVVAPDTGSTAYRDEEGRITAVRRFQQW